MTRQLAVAALGALLLAAPALAQEQPSEAKEEVEKPTTKKPPGKKKPPKKGGKMSPACKEGMAQKRVLEDELAALDAGLPVLLEAAHQASRRKQAEANLAVLDQLAAIRAKELEIEALRQAHLQEQGPGHRCPL